MSEAVDPLSGLKNDASTPIQDKRSRTEALHAKWDLEDIESSLENEAFEARQKNRCNELGMIIFGFVL